MTVQTTYCDLEHFMLHNIAFKDAYNKLLWHPYREYRTRIWNKDKGYIGVVEFSEDPEEYGLDEWKIYGQCEVGETRADVIFNLAARIVAISEDPSSQEWIARKQEQELLDSGNYCFRKPYKQ